MVCYEMMLACFEGSFQSSVSGSGWNEGPDLHRDWSLWPRCGVLHSGLWSGSKKMVITCLQPMWSQGHWRCAEVAGGVDSWSYLMLTALSASRSVGIELCGGHVWPVSSVTYAISALSKNQKDEFWVRMLQSPHCDRLQVPYLGNVKCLPKSPEQWIGIRIWAGLKAVLGYICALLKKSLICLGS